jgi:hypothetical protein
VSAQGRALLGSPVDIQAIRLVEGFVVRTADGIEGWAWHPAAPETDPVLRVIDSAGCEQAPLVAVDLGVETDGDTPFARPRGFRLPIARSGPVRVIGRDGRDLAGSPAANPGKARGRIAPTPKRAPERCGPVDVVVPVYKGLATTLACLHSVLETPKRRLSCRGERGITCRGRSRRDFAEQRHAGGAWLAAHPAAGSP